MNIKKYMVLLASAALLSSCAFKNEMAYPRVFAEITAFQVEHEARPTVIDKRNMQVNVVLNELADIHAVNLKKFQWTDGATATELPQQLDLSETIPVELTNYHTYNWKIVGTQPVERYIDCEGAAEVRWIPEAHQAQVLMLRTSNLKEIVLNDMKLGLIGSRIVSTTGLGADGQPETVDCGFPMTVDGSYARSFLVEYKGEQTEWTVIFEHMQMVPTVNKVLPWCWSAELGGEYDGVGDVDVEYRKSGAETWKKVDAPSIKGTKVRASLAPLKHGTTYEVRLVQGENVGESYEFTTGKPEQLPNMGFDTWSKKGKVWYPYEDPQIIWGSANPGVALSGAGCPTFPDYDHKVEGKASACMQTSEAFGILAAGNLFTGQFSHLEMTTAYLYWGTPFKERPVKLTGWYDYSPRRIMDAQKTLAGAGGIDNPYYHMKGEMDCMQIMVALVAAEDNAWKDKGAFSVISTKPGTPELNPEKPNHDPRIIAFAELISPEDTKGEFKPFELNLKYCDDREPAYAIVVACSSAYGNFFTGAKGSMLHVDDFKFVYK